MEGVTAAMRTRVGRRRVDPGPGAGPGAAPTQGRTAVVDVQAQHPLSLRFLAFVSATGLSSLGDAAWVIALTATLTRLSDAAVTGAVLALSGLPRLVAMLVGGAVADRRGPRTVMIYTDLLRCGVMAFAAVAVAIWSENLPLLVVLAAMLAFLGSFFVPASGALRPKLLPERHLVRGNALYLIGLRSGQASGGPVGAWLLGLGGIVLVAVANAASFLVSAWATLRCAPSDAVARRRARTPESTQDAAAGREDDPDDDRAKDPEKDSASTSQRIGAGVRRVLEDRQLSMLMIVIGLVELAGSGPVNVGLILVSNSIGGGVTGAGLLLTGYTVGATGALLLSLAAPVGRRAGGAAVASMVCSAAVLVAIGHSGSVATMVVLYLLLGAFAAQTGLVLVSMVQRRLPDDARARVMAFMSLLIFGAVPLGNLTIGVMVQALGVPTTMTVQAALGLAGALTFVTNRTLRRTSLA